MSKMKKSSTVPELTKTLDVLKNRIEREKRKIVKPLIPIILKAERMGKLGQLQEACRLVVSGAKETESTIIIPDAIAAKEIIVCETVVELPPTPKNARTMKQYLKHLFFD